MSYVIEMTDQARTDLRGIYEYIAFALQSKINADRQLDRIEREILSLSEMPERYKILEQVLAFPKQFAVEDLEQAMASNAFVVSKATIYNTIDLLVTAGILRRLSVGAGPTLYERVEAVSYIHLMCEHCKKVKLVKDLNFMAYMNARKFAAFTTSYYNLTIYGVCNDCARRIKREKRQLTIANRKKKQQ